ncbi:MAG: hypothetical protein U9R06_03785 [Patescibacteria group bacterium]|nr:hypothetical protein [Patescibacteria group bacterium]
MGVDYSFYDKDYRYYKGGKMYRDYPKPKDSNRDTIMELIELINKIDEKIASDDRFLESTFNDLEVNVYSDEDIAKFEANVPFNEEYDEKVYTLIHGSKILIERPRSHSFTLDLNSWEIEMTR